MGPFASSPALILSALLFASGPSKPLLPPSTPPSDAKTSAPVGRWYARLTPSTEHPVLFEILVEKKGGGLGATLVNDKTRAPFTSATWDGFTLTLELAHYDARMTAVKKDGTLSGAYTRTTASGMAEVPFSASPVAPEKPPVAGPSSVSGTWGLEMAEGRGTSKATGVFKQNGVDLTGTLLTTTGDYGPLHGTFDGERLELSVFDGVHVYRFDGELLPDGTMAGEFRSRANPPVPWRARRLEGSAAGAFLPDAFAIVRPKDAKAPYTFSFPDAAGKIVSASDERFKGKPILVAFSGTWCPNCADEAPVLRDLYAKYHARGLEVVSLSFEYTDDVERNRRQVKRFVARHRLEYPVLIAGTTKDTATSSATAPLAGWEGYPTTLFLDRDHRIVKIHSGFDGPATGERFTKLKKEMEEAVKRLLGPETSELVPPDATSIGLR